MLLRQRHIPNIITVARLALTVVFFILLHQNQPDNFTRTMWTAFGVFVVAAVTDFIDGYLARTWQVESAFGRVVDPFVDKIMICGAFIFFCSPYFINDTMLHKFVVKGSDWSVTGVRPWMAVVLIGREFLITSIRGLAEAQGIDFRADWAGKIKMFCQSVAVGAVLVDLAVSFGQEPVQFVRWTRDIMIWITLITTVASAGGYLWRARQLKLVKTQ
ncbi:MAG: CDP-alcohol phosphatidyltransferase family protein [Phycisphaerae bacterium]